MRLSFGKSDERSCFLQATRTTQAREEIIGCGSNRLHDDALK